MLREKVCLSYAAYNRTSISKYWRNTHVNTNMIKKCKIFAFI